MAQKKKAGKSKSTKTSSSASNVTRVRATDTSSVKKETTPKTKAKKVTKEVKTAEVVATPTAKTVAPAEGPKKVPRKKRTVKPGVVLVPFIALGRYFKGAWVELKQVHWPTRKATWSMTGAVLLYSAFFVVLVLLLDAAFKYLFELILAK